MMNKIDFFFNKLLPKKFIVFTVATIIVFKGISAPKEFWILAYAYYGVNSILKLIKGKQGDK